MVPHCLRGFNPVPPQESSMSRSPSLIAGLCVAILALSPSQTKAAFILYDQNLVVSGECCRSVGCSVGYGFPKRRPIMDDLSAFCCLNPSCADLGKRGHGNLTVTMRYGPNKSRRMLRCRTCTTRFSERKGTPLFDARLPPERVNDVLAHVAE